MTEGFAKIHNDIDNLRLEFKTELAGIKSTIKDLETSRNSTNHDVEDLEEDAEEDDRRPFKDFQRLEVKYCGARIPA